MIRLNAKPCRLLVAITTTHYTLQMEFDALLELNLAALRQYRYTVAPDHTFPVLEQMMREIARVLTLYKKDEAFRLEVQRAFQSPVGTDRLATANAIHVLLQLAMKK